MLMSLVVCRNVLQYVSDMQNVVGFLKLCLIGTCYTIHVFNVLWEYNNNKGL